MRNPTSEVAQNSNYLFCNILIAWGFKMSSFSSILQKKGQIVNSIFLFLSFIQKIGKGTYL